MSRKFLALSICVLLVCGLILSQASLAKKTTITYWELYGPKAPTSYGKIIEEFNRTHPEIYVNDQFLPSHTEILQKFLATAIAKVGYPELILSDICFVPLYADTGIPIDMMPFIEGPNGVDLNDWFAVLRDFGHIKGKQYSLAQTTNNIALFYNKELFKEAGLNPEEAPKNWDELTLYAQKLNKPEQGQWGVVEYEWVHKPYFESLSWRFQTLVWQSEGRVWNPDYSKVVFNSKEGIEGLQWWLDLVYKYKVLPLNPPEHVFESEKAAILIDGTWAAGSYIEILGDKLGTGMLPGNKVFATNIGGEHLMICDSSPEKEEASWIFAKWMTSEKPILQMCIDSGRLPPRKSTVAEFVEANPLWEPFMELMKYGEHRAPIPQYGKASEIIHGYVERVLYRKMDPQEALDEAVTDINEMLAKAAARSE